MIPDFFDFLLHPLFCSKIASGVLGAPTESISGKNNNMQLFRGNEDYEIYISCCFDHKTEPFFEFLLFLSYRSKSVRSKKSIFHDDFIEFNDKTEPYFFIFSCFVHISPKVFLEYWGRPLKVFEAKITICNFSWDQRIRNLYFTLTLLNLTTKTIPEFLILSLFLYFVPELLLEYWETH